MRFRRKSRPRHPPTGLPTTPADAATGSTAPPRRSQAAAAGPYDADDLADDGVERVDLGSLLITAGPGRELRLQVDERTQQVQAVLLAGADGALELRAFAAPRNGDLWSEVRPQIAADMARRGGTATERRAASAPSWSASSRCRRPTAGPATSRRGSSASTAPGGCCGPPSSASRRSTPRPAPRWEDDARAGRRTPWRPRDARRRPAPGRAARRRRAGVTPPGGAPEPPDMAGREPAPPRASAAGASSEEMHAERAAARPAPSHGEVSDRRRPRPRAGAPSAARCAPSRCARAAASPRWRPSSYDGSGALTLIFLGRRRIAGIAPGSVAAGHGPDRRARRRRGSCTTRATSCCPDDRRAARQRQDRPRPPTSRPSRRWSAPSSPRPSAAGAAWSRRRSRRSSSRCSG